MSGGSTRLVLVLVAVVACTPTSTSAPAAPSSTRSPPASASTGADPEPAKQEPAAAPPSKTVRDGSGRCDPEPKVGEPCGDGDSWCVLSWGEPGGWSSALWCRDGRWEREEEVNLPEEP